MPADSSKRKKASPARKQFATALRKARNALRPEKLSQEALAHKAGLERSYVGQVERGEVNISVDNMQRLADAVGKPLWELLKP